MTIILAEELRSEASDATKVLFNDLLDLDPTQSAMLKRKLNEEQANKSQPDYIYVSHMIDKIKKYVSEMNLIDDIGTQFLEISSKVGQIEELNLPSSDIVFGRSFSQYSKSLISDICKAGNRKLIEEYGLPLEKYGYPI